MDRRKSAGFGTDFKRYDAKLWDAIPLFRSNATREIERNGESVSVKLGKRPLHRTWTTMRYDSSKVIDQCIAERRNMGIRPRPEQMIIDIDPRHGGDEGFAELCATLGAEFDYKQYGGVLTGSGGRHLYMTKPSEIKLLHTVEGYPGVEFKGTGRQCLAAGCVHPETGKLYTFLKGHPDINILRPAPEALLRLIRREPRPLGWSKGGGHIKPHRLAMSLGGLDPEKFRAHEDWLQLMMACHHATGGAGRQEFIEWSTSDPEYADVSKEIGLRWDSLHAKHNGVKVGTLNRHLARAGRLDLLLPTRSAADVFADSPIPFRPEPQWSTDALQYFAERFIDDEVA